MPRVPSFGPTAFATLGLALGWVNGAHAQSRALDLQLFLPPPAGGSTFTIDRPTIPRHMTFVFGLGSSYARDLLVRVDGDQAVVGSLLETDLLIAMGLFEVMELGVAMPLSYASVAEDPLAATVQTENVFAPGDLRLSIKVPILRGDLGLAGRGVVALPTGDSDNFLGTSYWALLASAVASYQAGDLTVGGELGYRLRRGAGLGDLEQDDEIELSLGGAYALSSAFAAIVEGRIRAGIGGQSLETNEVPAEASIGMRWVPLDGVSIELGGGRGLTGDGYGTPSLRVFGAVRFATEREPCPAGAEDYDGFEDGDFCADPDNDRDGLRDEVDQCVNDPEDVDQFMDTDGCPDTDNDADGVLDGDDRCPRESEDRDGVEDRDGCPDGDNDEDGIPDGLDACPMEPEDRDQFQDEDGCPEPGPERAIVTVSDRRILVSERVYFDFDRDTIRSVSMPLLDQVAEVMGSIPAERRIRVEGYTDDQGVPDYNVDLSYRRARSVVEYLVGRGVPRARLDYVGYGQQNPVAPNDTVDGRALNRRVEFTILDAEAPAAPRERPRRERRRERSD